jgi:predicted RNA-binding protein with PUA domain
MGSWLWSLRSEGVSTILDEFFQKSVKIYESQLEAAEKAKDVDLALKLCNDIAEAYNKVRRVL